MPLSKSQSASVTNENQFVNDGGKQVLASRTALADVSLHGRKRVVVPKKSKPAQERKPVHRVITGLSADTSEQEAEKKAEKRPEEIEVEGEQLHPLNYEDIDDGDEVDPIFCTTYVTDIFQYLLKQEYEDHINPDYMKLQTNITERMRGILMNWIEEVHIRFSLLSETFMVSCNIVDRYLSQRQVMKEKLQLVGVAAILIASKYEEIYAVEVSDLIYISDNAYTREEILKAEIDILQTIQYKLSTPSPIYFVRRWSKAANNDPMTHTMAKYLCEESVLFYPMLKYLPSTIAAAAVLIARLTLSCTPLWDDTMRHYIGLDAADVLPCARELTRCIQTQRVKLASHIGHPLCSVKKKYDSDKLYRVGSVELPSEKLFDEIERSVSSGVEPQFH